MTISLKDLRDSIDKMGILNQADENDNTVSFRKDLGNDIGINYLLALNKDPSAVYALAILRGKDIRIDNDFHIAYKFCNRWNVGYKFPRAYVNESAKTIICDLTWTAEASAAEFQRFILVGFIALSEICFNQAMSNGVYS